MSPKRASSIWAWSKRQLDSWPCLLKILWLLVRDPFHHGYLSSLGPGTGALSDMGLYDKTLGTLLVGIFFNTYLYGLVTYQFAAYWRTYFNDPLRIRLAVLFLFLVDTAHSISVIYMAWEYCVTNFANPKALEVALWPYTFTPIATALAALATQIFLGYRICRLTDSRMIFVVILLLAFASFGLGMACGIRAWIISVLADLSVLNSLVTAWLSMQVGTDLLITGLLTFSLLRSKSGFRKTDNVLNRLVRGAIQTGVFAGIFSLSDLATFLQYPDTNMYGMFAIPIGRIYTNTLLDTLISRDELRARLAGTMSIDRTTDIETLRWATTSTRPPHSIQLSEVRVHSEPDSYSNEQSKATVKTSADPL